MTNVVPSGLVFDASVLIDYLMVEEQMLQTISLSLASIHVALPLLVEEIDQLSESKARRLGIKIVEPTVAQMMEAERMGAGIGPSYYDLLCLLVARDSCWTCVTAEKALYNKCVSEGVSVWRGFRPLLELVGSGHLLKRSALGFVHEVVRINPRMSPDVAREFEHMLR